MRKTLPSSGANFTADRFILKFQIQNFIRCDAAHACRPENCSHTSHTPAASRPRAAAHTRAHVLLAAAAHCCSIFLKFHAVSAAGVSLLHCMLQRTLSHSSARSSLFRSDVDVCSSRFHCCVPEPRGFGRECGEFTWNSRIHTPKTMPKTMDAQMPNFFSGWRL